MRFMEFGASRPNPFRTVRRTGPRGVRFTLAVDMACPSLAHVLEIKGSVLRARRKLRALTCHVALDVGEHGLEFGVVADRGERWREVAVVTPMVAPARLLRCA